MTVDIWCDPKPFDSTTAIAIIYLGCGDFTLVEWDDARQVATGIGPQETPRYVAGISLNNLRNLKMQQIQEKPRVL